MEGAELSVVRCWERGGDLREETSLGGFVSSGAGEIVVTEVVFVELGVRK